MLASPLLLDENDVDWPASVVQTVPKREGAWWVQRACSSAAAEFFAPSSSHHRDITWTKKHHT